MSEGRVAVAGALAGWLVEIVWRAASI